MDQTVSPPATAPDSGTGTVRPPHPAPVRKRSISGGLFSKLPFGTRPRPRRNTEETDVITSAANALPVPSFRTIPAVDPSAHPPLSNGIHQQQPPKTRRRRGSLRKVALLGRGARREDRGLTIDTTFLAESEKPAIPYTPPTTATPSLPPPPTDTTTLGLGISDITPRPSMDGYARRSPAPPPPADPPSRHHRPAANPPPPSLRSPLDLLTTDSTLTSPYSTTDDEDNLHMAPRASPIAPSLLRPSSATPPQASLQHRRTIIQQQRAKSPLALTSLASAAPPEGRGDWDYAETEWWGWVVLVVTWTVFVIGMGSCLGVWSWAWDVGTTPYAPPELEDDPTLPIVGYYPALIILTAVMAWVWVVVAWVGMKYFRHARVSGD
ncbi:hypothetical protein QBC39DRAFT_283031 [Podospora conica]|nr:hypothetical protein QBC39DRAFT_283031 [Schizothecium conicum]